MFKEVRFLFAWYIAPFCLTCFSSVRSENCQIHIFYSILQSTSSSILYTPYCFKSYGDFAEWVDFACCWTFSGGGSAINGATSSSFETLIFLNDWRYRPPFGTACYLL